MSWRSAPRPEWVRAVNAGEVPPFAEVAAQPLTVASLVAEAAVRQGRPAAPESTCRAFFDHREFPGEEALGNLERFLTALGSETQLTTMGRFMTRRFLLRLLEERLQLVAYLEQDPGVQDEIIEAPLFVAGAPRTGTTILHTLLAADPAHTVPEGWELLRPVPPPDPDPKRYAADPRIGLADRELVLPQTVVSGLLAVHEYGGRKPKECLSAMSFAFQSEELTARYHVPSFEAWLVDSDMTPAYRMHRLVLQVLQRRRPGTRWVLKSPVHLHVLPTLFETYPDARVAITHRDPTQLLASLTSLIANLRWAYSDRVDPKEIAGSHVRRYAATFDRLVDWTEAGRLPEAQLHHSQFRDFLDAPLDTVQRLYARFGLDWSEATEKALGHALSANPADRHGSHVYSQDDLGEPLERLQGRFARYQARCGDQPAECVGRPAAP